MKDVAFRICPIDRPTAHDMLQELKGYGLLQGARGQDPVDVDALVDAMIALGGPDGLLMRYADEIAEADLNPVIVSPQGAVAVDAAFVLNSAPTQDMVPYSTGQSAADMFRPLFQPRTIAVFGGVDPRCYDCEHLYQAVEGFRLRGRHLPNSPQGR